MSQQYFIFFGLVGAFIISLCISVFVIVNRIYYEVYELKKESKLLKPFMYCRVDCMGATLAVDEKRPVIRISIDDSNMVYLGE